jgi:hypothetical protein
MTKRRSALYRIHRNNGFPQLDMKITSPLRGDDLRPIASLTRQNTGSILATSGISESNFRVQCERTSTVDTSVKTF